MLMTGYEVDLSIHVHKQSSQTDFDNRVLKLQCAVTYFIMFAIYPISKMSMDNTGATNMEVH